MLFKFFIQLNLFITYALTIFGKKLKAEPFKYRREIFQQKF